ncbi:hypothetical protein HJD18_08320 [Thermoleophilia bacterium SCSIO 60948]|nr:hypothetical protein HJD18_08320 [Thermoleophilia bacterium SCSIO 60948]
MALLVWFTIPIAIWHFTVFVPDKFWGGIIGAFFAAIVGGVATGILGQVLTGDPLSETGMATVLWTLPGTFAALAIDYVVGAKQVEREEAEAEALL